MRPGSAVGGTGSQDSQRNTKEYKWNTKENTNNNRSIGPFEAVCKDGVGEGGEIDVVGKTEERIIR